LDSEKSKDEMVALLKEGICPFCSKKFVNPMLHINKKHGITPNEFKDYLMINRKSSFVSKELSQKLSDNAIRNNKADAMHAATQKAPREVSEKTRKKTSISITNFHKNNTESKDKLREAFKAVIAASAKSRRRAVIRIADNGDVVCYNSIVEAAKANNISDAAIVCCLRGRNKTAAGFRWKYK